MYLNPALSHQCLETEIDTAKANTQFASQSSLADLWRLM